MTEKKEEEKMKVKFELEAKIASQWWSNNIGFNAKQNNGNELESYLLAQLSSMTRLSGEQIKSFGASLHQRVLEVLNATGGKFKISVDYGPDLILLESAREVGISSNAFPCQTTMWIKPGIVTVSCGYQAAPETLYKSDNFEAQPGVENI